MKIPQKGHSKDLMRSRIILTALILHFLFIFHIFFGDTKKTKDIKKKLVVKTTVLQNQPNTKIVSTKSQIDRSIKQNQPITQSKKEPPPHISSPKSKPIASSKNGQTSKEIIKTPEKKEIAKVEKKQEVKKKVEKQAQVQTESNDLHIPEELLNQLEQKIANLDKKKLEKVNKKTELSIPKSFESNELQKIDKSNCYDENDLATYTEILVTYLKNQLKLPDFGEVKVEITLNNLGYVEKCLVVSAESSKNRKYLEGVLGTLQFPRMQEKNSTGSQQKLIITFCNEI